MKKLFIIPLLILFVNTGCKKEPVINSAPPLVLPAPPVFITPPKLSAGRDIQLYLPVDSCVLAGTVTAAGSNIKTYLWEKTSGPAAFKIAYPDSLITPLRALQEGSYTFQLTVTDSSGLQGKASVAVTVSSIMAFEKNLDLDIQTGYKFFDNAGICPLVDCTYSDITEIAVSVQLSTSDYLQVHIYEGADTAAQAYNVKYGSTTFSLTNQFYASGNSSFNLKKIIQQGGGTFSGNIELNLDMSSALHTGRADAFRALPPLTVTGKLDTSTHTVKMQIKGKIIF